MVDCIKMSKKGDEGIIDISSIIKNAEDLGNTKMEEGFAV